MLSTSTEQGAALLHDLLRAALARLLAEGPAAALTAPSLFDDDQRQALARELAAVRASAGLLGRSLVRDHGERARKKAPVHESRLRQVIEGQPVPTLQPEAALDFFRALVPTLGDDPMRLPPDLARTAFTLAVATEEELLSSVKDTLTDWLATGEPTQGPRAIQALLDAAGVSPSNSGYAETVFRTNAMDAYNQGAQDQIAEEADTFPVWQYTNPSDSRSRPEHAARDGNYYPAQRTFNAVRGTAPADVCNCRCVPIPIDRWAWEELTAQGARLAQA